MKKQGMMKKRRAKKQQPSQKKVDHDNFFEAQVLRKCEKCEDEDKSNVDKKSAAGPVPARPGFFNTYLHNINSKGQALQKGKRSFFENKMKANFDLVKVHTGPEATHAAKEIGAKAFTWQNHIVLNQEHYQEGNLEEKKLLAHELKHVQQQRNGRKAIQMMPEEQEEVQKGISAPEPGTQPEAETLEKEAELEEEQIMVPEQIPDFQTFGRPFTKKVFANSVQFRGQTDADFDDGVGSTQNLARTPAENCVNCAENDCWHYTGQLVINYSVTTSVTLPDVPEGLTECQHQRVRTAIDDILAPHEQEHVAAFNQYNGTVSLPIDYTGCSDGIQEFVQNLHDQNAASREATVVAASDALDPFHITVDLDCEDNPPANTPDTPEGEG